MTTTARNLLVELFVEELPPKALKKLGEAFADGLADGLAAQRLARRGRRPATAFATPRRLAVCIAATSPPGPPTAPSQDKLMPVERRPRRRRASRRRRC